MYLIILRMCVCVGVVVYRHLRGPKLEYTPLLRGPMVIARTFCAVLATRSNHYRPC